MKLDRCPRITLCLLLLAACGGKDPETTATTTGTSDDSATGPGVSTSGLSMSSSPTTSGEAPTTTGVSGTTTSNPTTLTTGDATTTDATTGPAMTTGDEPECLIEQPRPGQCDGGKPKQPGVRLADSPTRGAPGMKPIAKNPDEEEFATTGCEFICPSDVGVAIECDIFAQDCGPGEKCNAWANDGGSSWNATKCVPVDADPDLIGEPCTAEGGGISGIDSCAKGSMCFGINGDTGTCVEQCSCSIDNPVCTTQNTTCTISNNDSLALCLPVCDPLDVGACPAGDVCLAAGGQSLLFICVVDASGDQGAEGEDCQFQNACDPGLFCGPNNGQCGGAGCCTKFCDLDAPSCSGGASCTPFYEQGTAPKCFEDVGVCV